MWLNSDSIQCLVDYYQALLALPHDLSCSLSNNVASRGPSFHIRMGIAASIFVIIVARLRYGPRNSMSVNCSHFFGSTDDINVLSALKIGVQTVSEKYQHHRAREAERETFGEAWGLHGGKEEDRRPRGGRL